MTLTRTSDQPKPLKRKTELKRSPINRKTTRKCKICRQEFAPWRPGVPTCGEYSCNVAYALTVAEKSARKRVSDEKAAKKAERASIKARKEKIKPRGEYVKNLGVAHRAYIRARDEGKECISCPTILVKTGAPGGDYDAGHYRGVGRAKHLEFVDMNVNGQCKYCNGPHGKGMYLQQRTKMIDRYGLPAVEALEADNEPRKYSIEELKAKAKRYRALTRELLKGRE